MTKKQINTQAAEAAAQAEVLAAIRKALEALDISTFPQIADMMSAIKSRKHVEEVQRMVASAQAGTERVPDYTARH
ncbi:hypothetical protein [Mesorhizobium sp. YM1C-6-2]|uniref:hypothetical protein n=1 Tax=Mesorhizobium sp. YM1C-6-2 TaxID=1827501 RepID=UPI000EF1B69B|nr:hypothetical protein [Mesorhizobium sp. YM1C-6-2]RLP26595.1 hypothetical protein D8676_04985 [Mesorhizobium sp. YM1C-6-2]